MKRRGFFTALLLCLLFALFLSSASAAPYQAFPTSPNFFKGLRESLREPFTPIQFIAVLPQLLNVIAFERYFKKETVGNPDCYRQGGPAAIHGSEFYAPSCKRKHHDDPPGCLDLCPDNVGAIWDPATHLCGCGI